MTEARDTASLDDLDGFSPLVRHAEFELRRAGMFDADADYGGTLAPHVMELIRVFAAEHHTGMSAMLTLELFSRLARFQTLTPITSDQAEWIDRTAESGEPMWQSRRNPAVFSRDGGHTWYDLAAQAEASKEAPA